MESQTAAGERAAVDKAIAGLLFQGGLRRSEAAAADVQDASDGRGIVVYVRRSETDQDGTAADVLGARSPAFHICRGGRALLCPRGEALTAG